MSIEIKKLVPGYRAKWRRRYAVLLAHCHDIAPTLIYGDDGAVPWIEVDGGPRLFGFATEPKNAEIYWLLRADLPDALPESHFRLVKDFITRYLYPHMRPDLKPAAGSADELFGFHAQHKDALADLADAGARAALASAFQPRADDVIVDCGAFLGFGAIRMAEFLTAGHVYAIEATTACHELLARNMAYNRITNVTHLHRAVWNKAMTLDLQTDFAQANTLVREVLTGRNTEPVKTITLDQVVEKFGLAKLDMLSLTLNGSEVEALDGARATLADLRPRIRLAGWYKRSGTPIWAITKRTLERYQYRVFVGPRGNVMALPN